MKRTVPYLFAIALVLFTCHLLSCRKVENPRKKITYVNSYHQGFPPSDEITAGVLENLPASDYEVSTHFMDTKRNPGEEWIEARAAEILSLIRDEKPDLLIVSDDNALKYLVESNPQIKIPIVFCGVNWTVEQYDLSEHRITGILEILPIEEALKIMKAHFPSAQSLLVLNENTTTSRKTKPILDSLGRRVGFSVTQELVDDFEAWKKMFVEGNQSHDLIYLQTKGAIRGWDHDEALHLIEQHIKVPLITCESFMMPYAVFGLTQLSREQGERAAALAKRILEGARPEDIPISRNRRSQVWLNPRLAKKIGFHLDEPWREEATIIQEAF